jgi:protein-disulfide isomerase
MINKLREEKGNVWVAVSIIVAGILIAAAVIFTDGSKVPGAQPNGVGSDGQNGQATETTPVPEVTEADYIQGDVNAPIKIVEYSDPESPFCLRLHPTLKQLVEEYDGQVAWVYRHLDTGLHRKLMAEATAAECAGELGGNDTFWNYMNKIYDTTSGNDDLDLNLLPEFATELGIDLESFNSCMERGDYIEKVKNQSDDAFAAGARGTPFSVIIGPNGNQIQISGAQPINVWRQAVDFVIENELGEESAEETTTE